MASCADWITTSEQFLYTGRNRLGLMPMRVEVNGGSYRYAFGGDVSEGGIAWLARASVLLGDNTTQEWVGSRILRENGAACADANAFTVPIRRSSAAASS